MNERLDVELVRRKFFNSRAKSAEAIKNGNVLVNGDVVLKTSFSVSEKDKIEAEKSKYVSRAAKKLQYALKAFNVCVKDAVAVDVGASTGGFSQVLVENGAKRVFAVDVGTDQLNQKIAEDKRVINMQKTNFLDIDEKILKEATIIVSDVSFVSQTKLVNKYAIATCPIIILIKPQFECGKEYARKHKGIVKDCKVQAQCIKNVVASFCEAGIQLLALDVSPIYGGDGNKEFVALFQKNCKPNAIDIEKIVEKCPQL